jgi:hypothetical protein
VKALPTALCASVVVWAAAALAQDGGAPQRPTGFATLHGGAVRFELTDSRSQDERDPSTDAIRGAIARGLEVEQIQIRPEAKMVLRVQVQTVERRQGADLLNCAQVKARMFDSEKAFLPTNDVEAEHCTSDDGGHAKDSASNYAAVPGTVLKSLDSATSPKGHAYGLALADVLTTLERRLR